MVFIHDSTLSLVPCFLAVKGSLLIRGRCRCISAKNIHKLSYELVLVCVSTVFIMSLQDPCCLWSQQEYHVLATCHFTCHVCDRVAETTAIFPEALSMWQSGRNNLCMPKLTALKWKTMGQFPYRALLHSQNSQLQFWWRANVKVSLRQLLVQYQREAEHN